MFSLNSIVADLYTFTRVRILWARSALIFFALLTLLLGNASCRKSGVVENQNGGAANVSNVSTDTSSTPPFATKEPERYQAVRVISTAPGGETKGGEAAAAGEVKITTIARDGARRREDYQTDGLTVSFLELPGGSFLLLPEKKLYAELGPDAGGVTSRGKASAEPVLPPDKLLNEVRPQSHYEKLGTESINGRTAVKYRVTLRGQTGIAKETVIESLIWVDESLGMPIKTEMSSPGGAKVSLELRDIKETVEDGLFNLPQDYRKVEAREIFAQVNQAKAGTKP